ncbi:MAG: DsrE family protein [Gammaproteobacteria bacterium]|uniref:DsrE family protein n=1 Tax=Acidiferrobacter sp. SPIII_3 TaxID=1281578 RepID=UPI00197AB453|nr:DsrE family protein [Acidiferrobacter sp. SPIII_3]MDA8120521.1 DsrE family protein [Gammaproteobacteria bacterium]
MAALRKMAVLRKWLFVILASGVLAVPALAENWTLFHHYDFNKPQFIHSHPFAKEHLVVQVDQGNPHRWSLALSNVANVLNYFGSDKIQIVVVAYGPGLKMLFANSPLKLRVQSLNAQGVEFDACHMTMLGIKAKTGHLPKLLPQAAVVPGGVIRIMQLEQHGFDLLKP